MDLNHLRERINGVRTEADQHRKDAAKAQERAAVYRQSHDETKALQSDDEATKFMNEASRLEAQALELEREASQKQDQLTDIEQRQAALRQEFDQKMSDLDRERQNLVGISSTSLFF